MKAASKEGTVNPDRHCNSGETPLSAVDGTDFVGVVRKETDTNNCRSPRTCKSLVSVVASNKDDNDKRLAESLLGIKQASRSSI